MTGAVDHGMGYELCGMVSTRAVLAPVAAVHSPARLIGLEQGLALVPLTRELAAALDDGSGRVPPETGFWQLSPGVLTLLEAASFTGPIAYLEAEYSGRTGRQTAAVWEGGALVLGPRILGIHEPFPAKGGGPIGAALRRVGAVARRREDEFVVLGLGRCRSTAAWR